MCRAVGLVVVVLVLAVPAAARADAPVPCAANAPETASLAVTTNTPGLIRLFYFLAQAGPVAFYECEGERATYLGTRAQEGNVTALDPATTWRCDRLERSFAAVATLPDGSTTYATTDVHTAPCSRRYDLTAPSTARRGGKVAVRVADRWREGGVRGRLCVTAPHRRRACRAVRLAPGVDVAARSFRADRRGRWRVAFRAPHAALHRTVAVGVRAPARKDVPVVLATGDSTMMGVETFLADDLAGRADVISDVFPGAGISPDEGWPGLATKQVARDHPDVTVLSIGANEGYEMTIDGVAHSCCDDAWVEEWRRRFRRVVDIYRQHGRGRVVLLTIQLPKAPERVPVFTATNRVIAGFAGQPGIDVVHLDTIFSPNGYQEAITYRGREVRVRERDGIHLNVAGTAIAARAVVDVLAIAAR